jgi:hypothetical protein
VIGTIGTYERGCFEVIERINIDRPALRGIIVNKKYLDHIGCEVNLQGSDEFEIEINFNEQDFQFKGFAPLDKSRIDLVNDTNGIRAVSQESARYVLFFHKQHTNTVEYELTLSQKGIKQFQRLFQFVSPVDDEQTVP